MKTDIHSHILPALDDGAISLENSIELICAMKSWGFERITCTPHINALYRNTPDSINRAFELLKNEAENRGIDIQLRMSAEYRLVQETWPHVIENKWLMPIEERLILMELPISKPQEMGWIKPLDEFKRIIAMGLTPVLPHPERYFYLSEKELMKYVEAGVKIQCNYGSFAGLYGSEAQRNAEHIKNLGIISYYGTDMHNMLYVKTIGDWFRQGNPIAELEIR